MKDRTFHIFLLVVKISNPDERDKCLSQLIFFMKKKQENKL